MFTKVTVLDNVILFPDHYRRLAGCAATIQLDLGLKAEELARRIAALEASGAHVECVTECRSERLSDDELIARLQGTDCLITCWQPLSRGVLRALAPQLRLVLYWTDITRADLVAARECGIRVENVAEYGVVAVPEYVIAALLELLRRPSLQHKRARNGTFDYENFKAARKAILEPMDVYEESLCGKHLGIVGFGRIGRRLAAIANRGFGMKVSYFTRRQVDKLDEGGGVEPRALNELFEECDIVSLHLPPTASPFMINAELMERLRPASILVNTGSAVPVDYDALLRLLEARRFRAILDVFPGLPPRRRLEGLDNVFFSYRAAWLTREAIWAKGDILLSKLEAFLAGAGGQASSEDGRQPRSRRSGCLAGSSSAVEATEH